MQNTNQTTSNPAYTTLAVKLYKAIIWPEHKPTTKELKLVHRRIYLLIEDGTTPYDRYIEFVERLCIAQRYTLMHKTAPYFTIWLYKGYKYGINATDICYQHLQSTRATNPLFYSAQKAFAHAMLDIFEEGKPMQAYWLNWFKERNEPTFASMVSTIVVDCKKSLFHE